MTEKVWGHVGAPRDRTDIPSKHYHAWRLWTIQVPVDAEGWLEFCVRSWDSSNNTEPTYVRSAWKYVVLAARSTMTPLSNIDDAFP